MSFLPIVHHGGEDRKLGTLAPAAAGDPRHLKAVFGDVGTAKLIPRDQWRPVSLRGLFPAKRKDQDGVGMCNCSATGEVVEGVRRLSGLPEVPLSAGDLYRRVCGGVDRGSLLEDALKEAMEVGIAPESVVPYLDWSRDHAGAGPLRGKYRILEALWCPTFDHIASALQQGFLVDLGVWWYGSDPVDQDGWLDDVGRAGRGGHALCQSGLVERNGKWGTEFPNTWGNSWGKDGWGVLPEGRVADGCKVFQAWACRGVVVDEAVVPPLAE